MTDTPVIFERGLATIRIADVAVVVDVSAIGGFGERPRVIDPSGPASGPERSASGSAPASAACPVPAMPATGSPRWSTPAALAA